MFASERRTPTAKPKYDFPQSWYTGRDIHMLRPRRPPRGHHKQIAKGGPPETRWRYNLVSYNIYIYIILFVALDSGTASTLLPQRPSGLRLPDRPKAAQIGRPGTRPFRSGTRGNHTASNPTLRAASTTVADEREYSLDSSTVTHDVPPKWQAIFRAWIAMSANVRGGGVSWLQPESQFVIDPISRGPIVLRIRRARSPRRMYIAPRLAFPTPASAPCSRCLRPEPRSPSRRRAGRCGRPAL